MVASSGSDDNPTLPAHFVPGHVLSSDDVEQLRALVVHRDIDSAHGSLSRIYQRVAYIQQRVAQITLPLRALLGNLLRALLGKLWKSATGATGFLLVAFVLCLPLVWNIGYFSHDELQWLAFADKPSLGDVPWNAWFDFSLFQYRPLTFNLWLLLSHFIGYEPILMHLARVILALTAAWLLRSVLLQFEVAPRHAALTCWIWLLFPYTVYTHGWIGTYADSLCLVFVLMALRFTLLQSAGSWRQSALGALPVAALTVLALMSKESAIVFPAVILVAAFRRRDRVVAAAFAAATVVALIYLDLRLQTILFPHGSSGAYQWRIANIPVRLTEYTIFPFMVGHFEVIASRENLTNVALLCLAIFSAGLATSGLRRFATFWLGWIISLGPVLILGLSANQYAYLASAFACASVGYLWSQIRRLAKFAIALVALVCVVHGIQVMKEMRNIGRIQHHLYADLMPLLAHGGAPIRIEAQRNKDDFILRRLLNDIPSYRHETITGRVSVVAFVDKADKADYVMSGDGHLLPAR
jgi:hypothetical protein